MAPAKEGARVAVVDYKAAGGQETAQRIKKAGGEAFFIQVDVSALAQVRHMAQATVDAYGGIDVLFNGAAIVAFGTALDTDEKTWNRVLAINPNGTFFWFLASDESSFVTGSIVAVDGGQTAPV